MQSNNKTTTYTFDPHRCCRARIVNHNSNMKVVNNLFKNCKNAYYLFARPDILHKERYKAKHLKKLGERWNLSVQTFSFTWAPSILVTQGNSEHPKG